MTDTEGYGYPKGSRVYKINMQQALLLAIMNARFYQFNLEQVYLAAIPVTQQRFIFGPQFYAGMSPLTSPLTSGSHWAERRPASRRRRACRPPTRSPMRRGSRPTDRYRL